jgi:hypothetical protein
MKTQTIVAIFIVYLGATNASLRILPLDGASSKAQRDISMLDIMPGGIHGGPPSAKWRGDGPVRGRPRFRVS